MPEAAVKWTGAELSRVTPSPCRASPTWRPSARPRVSCSPEVGGSDYGGGRVAGARASAGGLLGGRWGGSERLRGASRRGLPPDTGLGSVLSPAPSGRPRRLPHCSASRSCRIWGILGRPLGLPSLLVLPPSFFLLFSLFPFSLLLSHSPRRTFLRTGGWLFLPPRVWGSGWRRVRRAGLGTITAQGSFLGGDGGGSGGGCGRGSPAPASNRTGR